MSFWALAGSLIKGVAADRAAKRTKQRADEFSRATAFNPFDVTSTLGSATFGDGTATTALSPELQAQFDTLLGQAGGFAGQMQDLDPLELQQNLFEQQQALFAPAQEQDRLAQENRLLAQGLLGSTTGALQTRALREAQGQQDLARQAQAFQQAQGVQSRLQQQQLAALQGAIGVGQLPQGLLGQGSDLGAKRSDAAFRGLQPGLLAGASRDTGLANFGKAAGGVVGSITGNPFAGLFGGKTTALPPPGGNPHIGGKTTALPPPGGSPHIGDHRAIASVPPHLR